MTVALRAHHLLCMLTYVGKGYGAAFVANYDRVAARLSAGEEILLVEGPDAICAPLLDAPEAPGFHCLEARIGRRDAKALAAVSALLGRTVAPGDRLALDAGLLTRFREAFATGTSRAACGGCQWVDLCNAVAATEFSDARVAMGPPPAEKGR